MVEVTFDEKNDLTEDEEDEVAADVVPSVKMIFDDYGLGRQQLLPIMFFNKGEGIYR